MSPDQAKQLLLDTHRGDHHAAVALYREFSPRMLAYARALIRHDVCAEDAVQQAFVRTLGCKQDELARVQDVLAWLVQLTRHASINALRTRTRSSLREKMRAGHERMNGTHAGGAAAAAPDSEEELVTAMNSLADDLRELLLLKHVAGLTFDQMALSLGENRNTLASRYAKAVGELKSRLSSVSGARTTGGRVVPASQARTRPQEVPYE